jgi:hypothetical protein
MAEIFAFATHTRVPPLGRCVMPLSPRTPAEDIEEQRDPPSWTNRGSWILTALTSCFGGL